MRRDPRDAAADALLFADHEEIQDIARQIRRTKVEMDRSVLSMRSWARDLGRRLAEAPRGLSRNEDLRALGETVGGLANLLRRLQTGSVRAYAASLFAGVVLVLGYYLWR